MRRASLLACAALGLAACSSSAPADWRFGPVIKGETYSPGMGVAPVETSSGFRFTFPTREPFEVDYVARGELDLRRATAIRMRWRVTGGDVIPTEGEAETATLGLVLQRRGDDWTGTGEAEFYRFYSPEAFPLIEGEFERVIPLGGTQWGSVMGRRNPAQFAETIAKLDSLGLTFGSAALRGHGARSTGAAMFELLSLEIVRD